MNRIILCIACIFCTHFVDASIRSRNGPLFLIEQLRPCPDCLSLDSSKVNREQLAQAFLAAKAASQMAEDFIGLSVLYFYDTTEIEATAEVYNSDIVLRIAQTNEHTRCLGKKTKEAANFISNTLMELSEVVNQLIIDSANEATEQEQFEEDYLQLQAIVDDFKSGFAKTLCEGSGHLAALKATEKAGNSLASFVANIQSYLAQLNAIAFDDSLGNSLLISSDYDSTVSLRSFVREAVYAVALTTPPCPIYRDKIFQFLKLKDFINKKLK